MMKPGRRRAPRLSIDLEASLSGRHKRPVRVLDLSRTGCLVQCETLLDHGAILDLELVLAPEPLVAKVRVTETYLDGSAPAEEAPRYLAGLEFLGLPAREETRLRRFLDELRRRRSSADASAH